MATAHKPAIAPRVTSFASSQFCQRLRQLAADEPQLESLVTATRKLLGSASAISRQVVRFLPQFTSHDDVHLGNVLGFMEQLAGGAQGIAELDAGDCAMAVWAAFVHDLGMVLDAGELAALDAADSFDLEVDPASAVNPPSPKLAEAWRAYRGGHWSWEAIRNAPGTPKSRMMLGQIRAAFIRDTHARELSPAGDSRIGAWLGFLSKDHSIAEVLETYALATRLVATALSHNQDISWLPRRLGDLHCPQPAAEQFGHGLGVIHWTWIGWLLRLADVFDCDKSRTPRVLYDHAGITDARSQTEWQKHLCISQPPLWGATADRQTLLYTVQHSPSPTVEKAVHQIIGWMKDEIGKVRSAWTNTPEDDRLPLALPSAARVDVKSRAGGYLYHDMEFRLDRDAVVELLMGEALYGGPELALRELVQNALDAVHLREQRNQLAIALKKAGATEKPRQFHAPWEGESPEVTVTWGTAKEGRHQGRRFVRVRDNGVGMTVGTMRRFLTQVGRSYYKSDEFLAERDLMRRHGILCSAISQFGIGFLSVFMLADEVDIHTRPLGATDHPPSSREAQEQARFPFRAEIHGPHGLLCFYPDEGILDLGTAVTVWLKDGFELLPWNRSHLIARLKQEFYAVAPSREAAAAFALEEKAKRLDVAFEIARFIVWPNYPVRLSSGDAAEDSLRIDDQFHLNELVPLDHRKMRAKGEWKIPEIDSVDWQACDWIDSRQAKNDVEGTGSRVRLVAPQENGRDNPRVGADEWVGLPETLASGHPRLLLGNLAEAQLPAPQTRYQCLVNGVRVVPGLVLSHPDHTHQLSEVLDSLPTLPGPGGWVWIDLRGAAMPKLRADRSAPISTKGLQKEEWIALHRRWRSSFPAGISDWLSCLIQSPAFKRSKKNARSLVRLGLPRVNPAAAASFIITEQRVANDLYAHLPGDQRRKIARDPALHLPLTFSRDLALALVGNLSLASDLDLILNLALTRAKNYGPSRDLALALDRDRDFALDFACCINRNFDQVFRSELSAYLASEGLWPTLDQSHPALGLGRNSGKISDWHLAGPLHVERGGHPLVTPPWMLDYHICSPFTSFPLPRLQREFPQWTMDPAWRTILMLPLLFGKEPNGWRGRLLQPLLSDQEPKGWRGRQKLPLESLMLLLPNPEHRELLFRDEEQSFWSQGAASVRWDLITGKVQYARGIHTKESLYLRGVPLQEFLRSAS